MTDIASLAIPGFGTYFQISNGDSPETFAVLGEVKDVSGIGVTHLNEDVTHQASPAGFMEKIALGLKENKPFNLEMNFTGGDYAAQKTIIQTEALSKTKKNYKISWPDAAQTSVIFSANISDVTIDAPLKGAAKATIQVTPSGGNTWAEAA